MIAYDYSSFINKKSTRHAASGIDIERAETHQSLFDYQKDLVKWSLRKGKSCIFAATGLGKTRIELDFARLSSRGGRALIVAPLAVASQTANEAKKMMMNVAMVRSSESCRLPGVYITNYEMLHHFDASLFDSVVLDESSILKAHDGKTRKAIMDQFARVPFKLACTATPAPNDHMELGTHAEFVNASTRAEMLATYFVHDGGDTSKWRLKGHAIKPFWDWVTGWAACVTKPSDLGYSDAGHELPPLEIIEHHVDGHYEPAEDQLFHFGALSATKIHDHMRETAPQRADKVAEIEIAHSPFIVWCNTNYDQDGVKSRVPHAIDVRGSDSPTVKENRLIDFSENGGTMLTKPSIAGFGLNWQHCNHMAFCGLSYSWEQTHQAIRRCWRFGQTKPVHVHFVVADTESSVAEVLRRKEDQYGEMTLEMREAMSRKMEDFR